MQFFYIVSIYLNIMYINLFILGSYIEMQFI